MSEIKFEKVTFKYSNEKSNIIDNFSIRIEKGSFVGIKGPSGIGKSTFLHLLAGFTKQLSGKILIGGKSYLNKTDNELSKFRNLNIGFVFQDFSLFPNLTVFENITLPGEYQSEIPQSVIRERANTLIKNFNLTDTIYKFPSQISGGQQQRVGIARALIMYPKLIIADEPTANLDFENKKEIIKIFHQLYSEGYTIIVSTHDPDLLKVCPDLYDMSEKKWITKKRQTVNAQEKCKVNNNRTTNPLSFTIRTIKKIKINKSLATKIVSLSTGIATVFSMITFSEIIKTKIEDSYIALGANVIHVGGKASDQVINERNNKLKFEKFDALSELNHIKTIFPQISKLAHYITIPVTKVFSDQSSIDGGSLFGISNNYIDIKRLSIDWDLNQKEKFESSVQGECLVFNDIAENLFPNSSPIGKILNIKLENEIIPCRVSGIATGSNLRSNSIFTNISYILNLLGQGNVGVKDLIIEAKKGTNVHKFSSHILNYLNLKYYGDFKRRLYKGMIEHMTRSKLILASVLIVITLIAIINSIININGLMGLLVRERVREIGLQKVFGASRKVIKTEYVLESIFVSFYSGLFGILAGFVFTHFLIYLASVFIEDINFVFVYNFYAFFISIFCILIAGVFGGLKPAKEAEKVNILEAIRPT